MATVSFKVFVEREIEDAVLSGFRIQLSATRYFQGCLACSLERDVENKGGIRFHTVWASEEHATAFLRSDIVDSVIQLLELSIEQPEILVCLEQTGIELLRDARNRDELSEQLDRLPGGGPAL